ncbi:hypothetical protein S40293_11456 [Stachybotrys chartarum IBT 40293]|nr:hypothetical protein S40293_11456 [Stachybotrys chartarum IBT 40293]
MESIIPALTAVALFPNLALSLLGLWRLHHSKSPVKPGKVLKCLVYVAAAVAIIGVALLLAVAARAHHQDGTTASLCRFSMLTVLLCSLIRLNSPVFERSESWTGRTFSLPRGCIVFCVSLVLQLAILITGLVLEPPTQTTDPSPEASLICLCAAPLPAYLSVSAIALRSIQHREKATTKRIYSSAITAVSTCVLSMAVPGIIFMAGKEGILVFYVMQCTAWVFIYLENTIWKWMLPSVPVIGGRQDHFPSSQISRTETPASTGNSAVELGIHRVTSTGQESEAQLLRATSTIADVEKGCGDVFPQIKKPDPLFLVSDRVLASYPDSRSSPLMQTLGGFTRLRTRHTTLIRAPDGLGGRGTSVIWT